MEQAQYQQVGGTTGGALFGCPAADVYILVVGPHRGVGAQKTRKNTFSKKKVWKSPEMSKKAINFIFLRGGGQK